MYLLVIMSGDTLMNKPIISKYSELVQYIIAKVAARPNFGKTLLWKILYFSDFNFYELHYKSITSEVYRKIEHGPAPCNIDLIIKKLIKSKKIKKENGEFFGRGQERYLALEDPILKELSAEEIKVVDKAIDLIGSMTARAASEYSHNDIPWKATANKDIIDYELVFHRTPLTSAQED